MATATFNEGASDMLAVMDKLWLQCTVITVNTCSYTDMVRLSKANIFQSTRVKRRRQSVSTAKKVKRHRQEIEEGPTYGAGMDI